MVKRIGFLLLALIFMGISSAAAVTAPGQCLTAAPVATKSIGIAVNLQADAPILPAFDPADPSGTSNYSTSLTVYDYLGQSHVVTIYFKKIAEGIWEWHARDAMKAFRRTPMQDQEH